MLNAERGGPFGRNTHAALAWAECEGAAPATSPCAHVPVESSPFRGRLRRLSIGLAIACVATAAWLAGDAAYLHAKAALGQQLLSRAWQASKATGVAMKPWPWADTHPVARLSVPALGVERLVLAGANGRTLAWGPGHVGGTALPGGPGNAIVTAHRDTHFAFLRNVVPGERIVVETAAGASTRYRVEATVVADHRSLLLPADDRETTLALVTCFPFDAIDPGTPLRYAVIARAE